MKQKTKSILQGTEVDFFYKILSQYESETNHKGYNYSRIDKTLQGMINLIIKKAPIQKPKERNTFYYTGSVKVADFLRHIRNSFAHCNIKSDNLSMVFTIYDEYQGRCTMSGTMDKTKFFKLIKEIERTRI